MSADMLEKLVALKCVYGKVDEPGLSPRLRFTLTEHGSALVAQHRQAFDPYGRLGL